MKAQGFHYLLLMLQIWDVSKFTGIPFWKYSNLEGTWSYLNGNSYLFLTETLPYRIYLNLEGKRGKFEIAKSYNQSRKQQFKSQILHT